jgi:hypothetical protein
LIIIFIFTGWEDNRFLTFPLILDPSFKLSLLPVEKWESYKDGMVVEILKLNGTLESSEPPSVAITAKNPFFRLMNASANITPDQMDQKLKLRAVSTNGFVILVNSFI